jgi:hypothetical protein
VNDIPENICDRTEGELTKVYERIIPPKDLIQTLLKYPHKSEKIETITRDHQSS